MAPCDAAVAGSGVLHRCQGLPVIELHDLRHTHATLLLVDGVPVKVTSKRSGHAAPR
jgi:integrase